VANKIIQPLAPVVGVVPGQTATLDIPIGPRYHVIWLSGTVKRATVAPALTDIMGLLTVKINGKPVRTHTADELNQLNTLMGASFTARANNTPSAGAATTWNVPIFLAEPWRKSYSATESMAWPTSWPGGKKLATLQIEIAVPAIPGTNATSEHAISAYAETDNVLGQVDSKGEPVFLLSKWNRLGVPYAGAGDLFITTLPRREIYQQISLFTQSGDPASAIKVKVEDRTIRETSKTLNDDTLVAREMNSAGISANRFDLVFDYDDLPSSALPMQYGDAYVQDFQVIPTLSAANASNKIVTCIYQTYGPLG
jgi:hypothetical protein